jgi:hypothetical protein
MMPKPYGSDLRARVISARPTGSSDKMLHRIRERGEESPTTIVAPVHCRSWPILLQKSFEVAVEQ